MIIQSKRVWVSNQFIEAQLEIEGKKILAIHEYNKKTVDHDYGDLMLVPGFIELHAHGAYGNDTNHHDADKMKLWIKRLPEEGVTSVLPTTLTDSKETLMKSVENVKNIKEEDPEGAHILGIHFEGPYLDMDYKGAQPPQFIAAPTVEEFKEYQKMSGGLIKYITIAAEHDNNYELTKYCSQNGVTVSIGHSSATYDEAILGIANGVNSFTHAFNGMSGLHHRNPNAVGTLMRSNTFAEIIADGHHVHPVVVHSLFKTKPESMILVTDSLSIKGMPKGDYKLGVNDIEVDEHGTAYIKGTDSISGSTLHTNIGLKRLVKDMLIPFDQALNAATLNPARAIRVDDHKGKLVAGYDADVVVMNDDFEIIQTYARGKKQL